MKLIKGHVREDSSRDVFWQKSFVENHERETLYKIIICVSEEFVNQHLGPFVNKNGFTKEVYDWFDKKIETQFSKIKSTKSHKNNKIFFDLYPCTETMFGFASGLD